ncbi:hypothetical protein T10_10688 [Trichinella papuae]|uniref:Uncharacterized protein n=1 Tax=Trichinella papuae TaxID=268474 RepID=A0A0V1M744_9BILA|nr:hypothetical protein T10_10688 [Trichinella papuae]
MFHCTNVILNHISLKSLKYTTLLICFVSPNSPDIHLNFYFEIGELIYEKVKQTVQIHYET